MAAHYQWTAEYGSPLANTVLTHVQNIYIHNGRALVTDPYNSSTATIEGRSPSTWVTIPKVNDKVKIYVTVSAVNWLQFTGRITDVQVNYGITPAMDTYVISCEGPLAQFGRSDLLSEVLTTTTTGVYAKAVATAAGLEFYNSTGLSIASGQTYTGNALQLINQLCQMEYGHLGQTASTDPDYMAVQFYDRNTFEAQIGNGFVDTAPTSNQFVYDSVTFQSAAANYYTKTIVNPAGLATQTAASGSAPFRVYQIDTLDSTTAQADSFADYLLNNFSNTASQITQFSCTDIAQTYQLLHQVAYVEYQTAQQQTITMRGTTYKLIIEGTTIAVTPDQTRYTFDVSAQDLNAYLILDNATFGQLDNNRLNF
jgi:hypothetical protein